MYVWDKAVYSESVVLEPEQSISEIIFHLRSQTLGDSSASAWLSRPKSAEQLCRAKAHTPPFQN
jgi:hypothetical protein